MIRFTVKGVTEVQQTLKLVGERARDATPAMRRIGALALEDAQISVTEGAGEAGAFRAPHPLTARIHGAHALLRQTGGLLASLVPEGPGNIFDATPNSVRVGTQLTGPRSPTAIGAFQQRGTSKTFQVIQYRLSKGRLRLWRPPGIPARPFLLWRLSRLGEFHTILASHILGEDLRG